MLQILTDLCGELHAHAPKFKRSSSKIGSPIAIASMRDAYAYVNSLQRALRARGFYCAGSGCAFSNAAAPSALVRHRRSPGVRRQPPVSPPPIASCCFAPDLPRVQDVDVERLQDGSSGVEQVKVDGGSSDTDRQVRGGVQQAPSVSTDDVAQEQNRPPIVHAGHPSSASSARGA